MNECRGEREIQGLGEPIEHGLRIRVFWTDEKKWFRGVVGKSRLSHRGRPTNLLYVNYEVFW